jgi:hypothetical protein
VINLSRLVVGLFSTNRRTKAQHGTAIRGLSVESKNSRSSVIPQRRQRVIRSRIRRAYFSFASSGGGIELISPIRIRPAASRAVMPGDEKDGREFGSSTAFTAHPVEKIFKGHIALAFDQQLHRVEDRTASTVETLQLDHAVGPIRQSRCCLRKRGGCIPPFSTRTERTRAMLSPLEAEFFTLSQLRHRPLA